MPARLAAATLLIGALAASPAAAHELVVYFAFDSTDPASISTHKLEETACYATMPGAPGVQIVGHADSAGDGAYNQALSARRAAAVAKALIDRGVAPSQITTEARGETQPAVVTGDGVREPLNRRVALNVNWLEPRPADPSGSAVSPCFRIERFISSAPPR